MAGSVLRLLLGLALALAVSAGSARAQATVTAVPAPAPLVAELGSAIERARTRFEARDLGGVLASVSEHYRSSGITKGLLQNQLAAMFAVYRQLQARVTLERVQLVGGSAWVYTSGEVAGWLPVVGWVVVLSWQDEPEVARREEGGWRLFGFQD